MPKGVIELSGVLEFRVADDKEILEGEYGFDIVTEKRVFRLITESESELNEWMTVLIYHPNYTGRVSLESTRSSSITSFGSSKS